MWTRISIEFYKDASDAVFKKFLRVGILSGFSLRETKTRPLPQAVLTSLRWRVGADDGVRPVQNKPPVQIWFDVATGGRL